MTKIIIEAIIKMKNNNNHNNNSILKQPNQ